MGVAFTSCWRHQPPADQPVKGRRPGFSVRAAADDPPGMGLQDLGRPEPDTELPSRGQFLRNRPAVGSSRPARLAPPPGGGVDAGRTAQAGLRAAAGGPAGTQGALDAARTRRRHLRRGRFRPPQQRSRQGRVQVGSDLGHDLLGVADPRRPAAFAAGPTLPLPPPSLLSLPWFLGFFWRPWRGRRPGPAGPVPPGRPRPGPLTSVSERAYAGFEATMDVLCRARPGRPSASTTGGPPAPGCARPWPSSALPVALHMASNAGDIAGT